MSDIFEHTEVVAEALCTQDEGTWRGLPEPDRDHYRALAMAGIVALENATRCKRSAVMGPRCELDEGHDGPHRKSYEDRAPFTWTDEAQQNLLKGYRLD